MICPPGRQAGIQIRLSVLVKRFPKSIHYKRGDTATDYGMGTYVIHRLSKAMGFETFFAGQVGYVALTR